MSRQPFPERAYVSHSSMVTYRNCELKWAYEYVHGYGRRHTTASRAIGSMWADLLESGNDWADKWDSLRARARALYNIYIYNNNKDNNTIYNYNPYNIEEVVQLIDQINILYVMIKIYRELYPIENIREYSFSIPIYNNIYYKGIMDGITDTSIIEDKYLSTMSWNNARKRSLVLDNQINSYLWAASKLGLPDTLDYRVTLKPTIKQRRSRSVETEEQFIERVESVVRDRVDTYFQVTPVYRSESDLDKWLANAEASIKKMLDSVDDNVFVPNTSRCHDYGGCDFLDLCTTGGMDKYYRMW